MNRRNFLKGLLGSATVIAAGAIPAVIEKLSDKQFIAAINAAMPRQDEVYGDSKGNYAFAKLEYLDHSPYFKITLPDGFRPLREESDRIAHEVMNKFRGQA